MNPNTVTRSESCTKDMQLYVQVVFAVAPLLLGPAGCRRSSVLRAHRDVVTPQGAVRGYLSPTHASYLGVPYARAPIPPHRYKAPEPSPTWDGIFEATHKIKCPQPEEDADDNCLVINIFTPRHHTLLPVYVMMHAGGFHSGWGSHEPSLQILKEGYVMVTFNYRLGALGFLCLGTEDALGNAGLKDQIAALHWINKNIQYFGGDPNEVTVHGIKSAAKSIQLLLLSGLIDGLVHKAIMESDSALSPLAITYDPLSIAYRGAISIGYQGTTDTEELLKFYNEISWKDLINIPETFSPCFEDKLYTHSLINYDPRNRLRKGDYVKIPIMITYTDNNDIGNVTKNIDNIPDNIAEILPSNLAFDNNMIEQQIEQIIKEFYFGNGVYETDLIEQIYLGYNYDVFVEYPIVVLAMLYAAKSPYMVYLLKFETHSYNSIEDSSVTDSNTIIENLYKERDDNDIYLQRLITLWRNFMEIGDPTPLTTNLIPIIWQPVVTEVDDRSAISKVPTLHFGKKLKMTPPPRNQQLLFWHNIYNRFSRPHFIEHDKSEDLEDDLEISDYTN